LGFLTPISSHCHGAGHGDLCMTNTNKPPTTDELWAGISGDASPQNAQRPIDPKTLRPPSTARKPPSDPQVRGQGEPNAQPANLQTCEPAAVPDAEHKRECWDAADWLEFGFPGAVRNPDNAILSNAEVPRSIVIIAAETAQDHQILNSVVMEIPTMPRLVFEVDGRTHHGYRLAKGMAPPKRSDLPDGVVLLQAGDCVQLPLRPQTCSVSSVADLPMIPADHFLRQPVEEQKKETFVPLPVIEDTPLAKKSLRGKAAEYEARSVATTLLFGEVCLTGEVTLWYGAPNAGKTLIYLALLDEAVTLGRVAPGNVYYINADDSSEGFATKLRLADDLGVHTLCPGQNGFEPHHLGSMLSTMAEQKKAKGVVVIVDTAKKFCDLMSKREASEFGDICRRFTMAGGTVLLLAHTNKNASASGQLIYAGTADLLQDADAAYILTPLEAEGDDSVIEFIVKKQRGVGVQPAAYAYAGGPGISYAERLTSVRLVDPAALGSLHREIDDRVDEPVIEVIKACIEAGVVQKMALAKAAAKRAKISVRAAMRVLERYTGESPGNHQWTYRVKERGAKVFELLGS